MELPPPHPDEPLSRFSSTNLRESYLRPPGSRRRGSSTAGSLRSSLTSRFGADFSSDNSSFSASDAPAPESAGSTDSASMHSVSTGGAAGLLRAGALVATGGHLRRTTQHAVEAIEECDEDALSTLLSCRSNAQRTPSHKMRSSLSVAKSFVNSPSPALKALPEHAAVSTSGELQARHVRNVRLHQALSESTGSQATEPQAEASNGSTASGGAAGLARKSLQASAYTAVAPGELSDMLTCSHSGSGVRSVAKPVAAIADTQRQSGGALQGDSTASGVLAGIIAHALDAADSVGVSSIGAPTPPQLSTPPRPQQSHSSSASTLSRGTSSGAPRPRLQQRARVRKGSQMSAVHTAADSNSVSLTAALHSELATPQADSGHASAHASPSVPEALVDTHAANATRGGTAAVYSVPTSDSAGDHAHDASPDSPLGAVHSACAELVDCKGTALHERMQQHFPAIGKLAQGGTEDDEDDNAELMLPGLPFALIEAVQSFDLTPKSGVRMLSHSIDASIDSRGLLSQHSHSNGDLDHCPGSHCASSMGLDTCLFGSLRAEVMSWRDDTPEKQAKLRSKHKHLRCLVTPALQGTAVATGQASN